MPDPKKFKERSAFISTCVKEVMSEGKDQKQALGKCFGMWKNKEKEGK